MEEGEGLLHCLWAKGEELAHPVEEAWLHTSMEPAVAMVLEGPVPVAVAAAAKGPWVELMTVSVVFAQIHWSSGGNLECAGARGQLGSQEPAGVEVELHRE